VTKTTLDTLEILEE